MAVKKKNWGKLLAVSLIMALVLGFAAVGLAAPKTPSAPVADFNATPTSGIEPLTVNFTDLSTGRGHLTYAWDLDNDGIVDSTQANPTFVYSAAGTYSVKLTVTSAAGSDEELKTDYIVVGPPPLAPVADFSADPTGGTAPLEVSFTDLSTGTDPLTYAWDFDSDGTVDSTEQNPTYTYSTAGTYSITLNVTNDVGNDEKIKTDYITVNEKPDTDVLYDGAVTLTTGATFDVTAYNSTAVYTVSETTPLGALQAAAAAGGFTYDVTDKNYATSGALLLDNVGSYLRKTPGYWYAYVNDVYKDGYNNAAGALNLIELVHGDRVEFYYAADITDPTDLAAVKAAATAAVKTVASIEEPSTLDVLYDGAVTLTTGATFDVTAYNSTAVYTVSETTPLGALQAAAAANGFTYDVTDKNYATSGALLLDNVGSYLRDKTNGIYWYAYVNDVYKDGYNNAAGALNLIELVNGDRVEFYYAGGIGDPTDLAAVQAAATAAVKTVASIEEPSTLDVLYDGAVTLTTGATFDVTAYNSTAVYTVSETTPLGALQAAAAAGGFTYDVTDKNYATSGALLLDNVGSYLRKTPGYWYAYVNDVYKDGYNNAAGALNLIELVHGDRVEFYYAADITDPTDLAAVKAVATAAVKTVASTGVTPDDWTLQLSGAQTTSVTKTFFEDGLACSSSGHQVFWTDADGYTWGGVPLWLLVGMVDDDPDVGIYHFNFNDDLAAQGYQVNVIAGDGWSATFNSADMARNNDIIVANTLNGEPLPLLTESGKPCWPLYLKGASVLSGQQVGNIVKIELTGLPEPPSGWTLEMLGDVGDTITQEEFEEGIACNTSGHYREWTDINGNVWSGVPLWVLLGAVDDIETSSHWTFNDTVAAAGYTVNVIAGDGFTKTFNSSDVARSDNYIVANEMNGLPLTDSWPLRLVGPGVVKTDGTLGGSAVGNIVKIEIPELQTPPAASESWNLTLTGKISDVISQADFEAALACPTAGHLAEWTDIDGNVWSGMPLWFLTGWVDDRQPHAYDANQAMAGYTVLVKAGDGYNKGFASADVAWSNDYIIADKFNGAPLTDSWPLRLVGAGVATADGALTGTSVGNVIEIELTDFQTTQTIPEVHIIKYGEDGTTIINEKTVDYTWMQANLDVIGDGTTVYRYEGITNNPDDVWDAAETYPGGYKMANAVKGTRVKDLCDLVGGMGAGTEIVLTAKDGYETTLPYSCIYTNPAVQARQGDAILAWWGDGKYVPYYADGMRLFFTPDGDNVYGQWDMHETLTSNYWHYYYNDGIQYPSCAGLSSKWITKIEIYSLPAGDWTLALNGQDIGGLEYDVSKTYFEQALACQFGANHKASYTDSEGRVWEGMPLWFLAGFVDDEDQHSDSAFNDELALAGYQVVITADDGYSVAIDSTDIIRNSDYIIANSLNGAPIPDTDSSWPLRLVGPAVSGQTSIAQIVSIDLVKLPALTLVVDITGSGTVTKSPDQTNYNSGTQVILTAIPTAGYEFTGWSGDLIGTDNPGTVLMDSDKNITANFAVTYASLGSLVESVVTKPGVAETLLDMLDRAREAEESGKLKVKERYIDSFIKTVTAQTDKCISPDDAALLISLVSQL